jgi:hypothetical protein
MTNTTRDRLRAYASSQAGSAAEQQRLYAYEAMLTTLVGLLEMPLAATEPRQAEQFALIRNYVGTWQPESALQNQPKPQTVQNQP